MIRKTTYISLLVFTFSLATILSALAGETASLASQEQNQGQGTYTIGAGDILEITTWKEEDFSRETVPVRLDGMITFPLIDDVRAEGRTTMQVKAAIELIMESERPVLYAGGGIIRAEASDELRNFAELANLPTVTTLMGRGAIPDSHALALGMPGMHGNYTAITSMQKADLLVTVGARFDDRVTGDPSAFAPLAKVIHVDVDPAEIGKVRNPEVPIVGDAKAVLGQLISDLRTGAPLGEEPLYELDANIYQVFISFWY